MIPSSLNFQMPSPTLKLMMSGASRRTSVSSLASGKRPAVAGENASLSKAPKAKVAAAGVEQAKKRVALGNITNQSNAVGRNPPDRLRGVKGSDKAGVANSTSVLKKGSLTRTCHTRSIQNSATTSSAVNSNIIVPGKDVLSTHDEPMPTITTCLAPRSNSIPLPSPSGDSASLDETMSTCDSMKSPDFEYIDNGDSIFASLERRANENLHISDYRNPAGSRQNEVAPETMEIDDVTDVDTNHEDPQFCTTLACDIYRHLRSAEMKKRPCTDFMETIQKDINASMRSILIDWLVEVSEEYRLVPDTLYLAVNYIDRYLSGNEMSRQRLQLLGVACMLIAAKYEEISAPQVEEFCYITDNTYFKDEVLQMEADVLKYLKFEMTAPTAKCFLRRFIRAAQACSEVPTLQLEFLANYVAELSLLEYNFLKYSPSIIAASAVFLAKFMLQPTKRPWNATLCHYTLYKPSDLCDCVKALHLLLCNSPSNSLPAIREKYSQHKYKFVAKEYCPPAVPSEFFKDAMN